MIIRHAGHPTEPALYLCGMPVVIDNTGDHLAEVGLSVNCPECRVVVNFCRRCIAPSQFTLVRVA